MAHVSFHELKRNTTYSRPYLAELWGYKGFQPLSRGVVTPAGHRLIILFVTRDKQSSAKQYKDRLDEDRLFWEGPTDHFAEARIVDAKTSGDEIHLFYRERHHSDFEYLGQVLLEQSNLLKHKPSEFVFRLRA
jgi:putative restriction endonuclease